MARYALVVGITQYDYPYSFPNLTKPVHEAEAVARLLEEWGGEKPEGFQKIVRLPEGWNNERGCPQVAASRVTSEQFVQALQTFLEEAGRGDALIYFSGHGFVVADKLNQRQNRKKGYLATSDSQAETIAQYGIPFDSLNTLIRDSNLNSLVLLLDCCHAGSYLERDLVEQTLTAFGSQKDYYLIAACRATEKAYEGEPEQENSVFTEALLKGLAQEQADRDGQISCDRLFDFIYKSKKLRNFGQQPIRLGLGGSITLVTYPIENQEPVALNRQNPYQGLKAFEFEQAAYFYGREKAVRDLLVRLNKDRFLSVIGPSGSGKSSLVKAGLLPQLRSNRISESSQWEIESLVPGRHPLTPLQEIFARQHRRNQPYVLFIDQFEEIFTVCEQEEERRTFLQLITDEATNTERLARVIVALRGDFLDRCGAYPEPAMLINSTEPRTYIVPPLSLQEWQEAIKNPAEQHGVMFEEGLVSQILEDVEGQPGALPLLQYALSQLWRVCVENSDTEQPQLTKKGYKEIGGVKGALNETANNLYHARLLSDQVFIRDLFMQMVQVEGDKVTRRPISWERLEAIANSPEQVQRIVGLLANQRLLVTDEKNVQVVHEALLSEWVLLRNWIEENRENIRLSRRLEEACREWVGFKNSDEALLSGALLGVLEEWKERTNPKLLSLEAEYLNKSIEQRNQQLKAEIERIEHQLEQERQLRELAENRQQEAEARVKAESQRTKLAVIAGVLLGVLAISTSGLTLWAKAESNRATRNEIKALVESSKILYDAGKSLDALMASIKALEQLNRHNIKVPVELQNIIYGVHEYNRLEGHNKSVVGLSWHPKGNFIASGGEDGTIKIWRENGNLVTSIEAHKGKIRNMNFSPDGQFLASGSWDESLNIWKVNLKSKNVINNNPIKINLAGKGVVQDVQFSFNNENIAALVNDKILIWKVNNLQNSPTKTLVNKSNTELDKIIYSINFNAKQSILTASFYDGNVRLWNLKENEDDKSVILGQPQERHKKSVFVVKFSPEPLQKDDLLASGGEDGKIKLWKIESTNSIELIRTISAHDRTIVGLAFSPNSEMIGSASEDGTIKIWNVKQAIEGKELQPKTLRGHDKIVNRLEFSPNDKNIASTSDDGTVRLWQVNLDTEQASTKKDKPEIQLRYSCNFLKDYLKINKELPSVKQVYSICKPYLW
jgi:WD40 repeat protein/energy-coupling factor transporter ATP-binding protein EcfA2